MGTPRGGEGEGWKAEPGPAGGRGARRGRSPPPTRAPFSRSHPARRGRRRERPGRRSRAARPRLGHPRDSRTASGAAVPARAGNGQGTRGAEEGPRPASRGGGGPSCRGTPEPPEWGGGAQSPPRDPPPRPPASFRAPPEPGRALERTPFLQLHPSQLRALCNSGWPHRSFARRVLGGPPGGTWGRPRRCG